MPLSILGVTVKGDLAGHTVYTDRYNRKVFYVKAPPTTPPTPMQVCQRQRFTQAVECWNTLALEQKAEWERLSLTASLPMTGHNVFMHVALTGDFTTLATLERQTGITVEGAVYIPQCGESSSSSSSA
ncbi:MAG: hypothetical protein GTO14_23215 [Anaerolineales bacterium]|nr:hypothetical protein [Anaerolineales bacterium]